jgi:hypothetical protein
MQVTELYPVSRETIAGLIGQPQIVGALRDETVSIDLAKVFSFDALASRLNFKRIRAEGEDAGDEGAAAAEVAAGDASKPASTT